MQHLLWLWLWFFIGMTLYWAKRGYYLITGPNPVATNFPQFVRRCGVPLLVRAGIESGIFWLLFAPTFVDRALSYLGWTNMAWAVMMITQFAVFAFFFGLGVDSIGDFLVSKLPVLKDFLPQMPAPLPRRTGPAPLPPQIITGQSSQP